MGRGENTLWDGTDTCDIQSLVCSVSFVPKKIKGKKKMRKLSHLNYNSPNRYSASSNKNCAGAKYRWIRCPIYIARLQPLNITPNIIIVTYLQKTMCHICTLSCSSETFYFIDVGGNCNNCIHCRRTLEHRGLETVKHKDTSKIHVL